MSSLKLFEVVDKTLEFVLKQLNYPSVNSFNDDVAKIKEWMKQQPHFPEIMDDKKIQNFLILNKGRMEKTKQKIENYYTMRSRLPEVFENPKSNFSGVPHFLEQCYFIPLPKQTKEKYRVFFYKTRNKSMLNNFNAIDGIQYVINVQEIRLLEDVTYGDIFILDGKDLPFSAFKTLTPSILYKALISIYKNVFSYPLKGVYILNAPQFTEIILSILKTVLKPKMLSRVHILNNYERLYEIVEKEILPKDLGGGEKSLEELQEAVRQKFQEYMKYFDHLCELRVNEKLRLCNLKNDEFFGFYGNFKKLEVD